MLALHLIKKPPPNELCLGQVHMNQNKQSNVVSLSVYLSVEQMVGYGKSFLNMCNCIKDICFLTLIMFMKLLVIILNGDQFNMLLTGVLLQHLAQIRQNR